MVIQVELNAHAVMKCGSFTHAHKRCWCPLTLARCALFGRKDQEEEHNMDDIWSFG